MNLTVAAFASPFLVSGFLLTDAIVCAQDQTTARGRVTGTVADCSDAVLPGVKVTLTTRLLGKYSSESTGDSSSMT